MTPEERAEYRRTAEVVKAHGRETATTVITCGHLLWLLDAAESTPDPRCQARALVHEPDHWKRCVRAAGHVERHAWIESLDRVDGLPSLVTWEGDECVAPDRHAILVNGQ